MSDPVKSGIVVFNQAEELDFVGPREMLTMWSKHADGFDEFALVSPDGGELYALSNSEWQRVGSLQASAVTIAFP